MRSDELIVDIREMGGLPSTDPNWTNARLLALATELQRKLFAPPLVKAREGNLLHQQLLNTTAGQRHYRMPHRAVTANPERIEIRSSGSAHYIDLIKAEPREIADYESSSGTGQGTPVAYTNRGDGFELLPTPSGAFTLRVHYYLRPSAIVAHQTATKGGGLRGLITAVDTSALTITVDELPLNQLLSTPAAITTGNERIDIVRAEGGDYYRPSGSNDIILADVWQTLSGLVITLDDADDYTQLLATQVELQKVRVGDYVRAAGQSEWPVIPADYHHTLAEATAAVVLRSRGQAEKAAQVAGNVASDIEAMEGLLATRPKDAPKKVRRRFGILRSGGGRTTKDRRWSL